MSNDDPFSQFLYPFLEDQPETSQADKLKEAQASILQKAEEIKSMRRAFIAENRENLVRAAETIATAVLAGKQILTMGNGGSATDAADLAADFLNAPDGKPAVPAISLTNDFGLITAVGNDVGFDNIFLRQLIAYGQRGDVLVGFSTSGQSANLISTFEKAKELGLITIGITGYDGGRFAAIDLDYCFIVQSSYIPRIQEVHATLYHALIKLVHKIIEGSNKVDS